MSTIHGTTELGPATAKRQVYSPLETYWNTFLEWRKRASTTLADLAIDRRYWIPELGFQ